MRKLGEILKMLNIQMSTKGKAGYSVTKVTKEFNLEQFSIAGAMHSK